MHKDEVIDRAVCLGCGVSFTRRDIAHLMRGKRSFSCPCCQWEYRQSPHRPWTLRELLDSKEDKIVNVDGEINESAYVRKIAELFSLHFGNRKVLMFLDDYLKNV